MKPSLLSPFPFLISLSCMLLTLLVFAAQTNCSLSSYEIVSPTSVNRQQHDSNLIEPTTFTSAPPIDTLEFQLKRAIFSAIANQNESNGDHYYDKNYKQIFLPLFEKVELIANLTGFNENQPIGIELYNGNKVQHYHDNNQTNIEPMNEMVSDKLKINKLQRDGNLKVIDTEEDQLMSESYPRRHYRRRPRQHYYNKKRPQMQRKITYGKPQYRRFYLKPKIHPADSYYYKDDDHGTGKNYGKGMSYDDEVYNHIADQKHVPHQYAIQIRWSKPNDNQKNYRSKNDEKARYRSYAHQEEEHWHDKNWIDIGNPPQLTNRDEATDESSDYLVQSKRFNTLPVYARPIKTGASLQTIRQHFAVPSKSFPVNRRFVQWSNSPINFNSKRRGDYGSPNYNFRRASANPPRLPHYHF